MTKLERWSRWLSLLANLGVVCGLVFVALEIRTNTATNRIAIYQSSSTNWMELNGQLALDAEFAAFLERAESDAELDAVERRRFEGWVRQHLTHAAQMRRLYDAGLLSEAEIRQELGDIRALAEGERFREVLETLLAGAERFRGLILDEHGFDRWL